MSIRGLPSISGKSVDTRGPGGRRSEPDGKVHGAGGPAFRPVDFDGKVGQVFRGSQEAYVR